MLTSLHTLFYLIFATTLPSECDHRHSTEKGVWGPSPHFENRAPFQNPVHARFKCRSVSHQSLRIPFDQRFHTELPGYWCLKELHDSGSYFNVPGLCFLIHNSQIKIVKLELSFGTHIQAYLEDIVQLVPDHHNKCYNKASHTN